MHMQRYIYVTYWDYLFGKYLSSAQKIVKSELFMLTESNIIVATGQKCANDSMEPRQSTGSSRIFFSKFDWKYVYSIKEKRDENQLILYISSSFPDSPSQVKRLVNNKLFSW